MLALPAGGKTDIQMRRREVDIDRHTDGERRGKTDRHTCTDEEKGGKYRQTY